MAFTKLQKPARRGGSIDATVTIGASVKNRQTYLALNGAARQMIGDPVAVYLEFDQDEQLLRIVASSPDDPAAYRITKNTGRISVTQIMRELDLTPAHAHQMPAKKHGRQALVVDVSQMRTGAVVPMRRAS